MRQFIPFEDEWDMLENLDPARLIPYQVGLPCQRAERSSPSVIGAPPACVPMYHAVPVGRPDA